MVISFLRAEPATGLVSRRLRAMKVRGDRFVAGGADRRRGSRPRQDVRWGSGFVQHREFMLERGIMAESLRRVGAGFPTARARALRASLRIGQTLRAVAHLIRFDLGVDSAASVAGRVKVRFHALSIAYYATLVKRTGVRFWPLASRPGAFRVSRGRSTIAAATRSGPAIRAVRASFPSLSNSDAWASGARV